MSQLTKNMSATAGQSHHYQATGARFGLESRETQVVERSAFIDGSAARPERQVDICGAVVALFQSPNRPISVTVVLPSYLPFEDERKLARSIVACGGAVALRRPSESFEDVVEHRRAFALAEISGPSEDYLTQTTPLLTEPDVQSLAKYFATKEERLAMREAYKQEDSSSILS